MRNLIGDAHWLSDGHHKEELIRQFLARYLPRRFRVTRGFICAVDPAQNVSREIDVLVTDSEAELPWFSEGDLTIAPPSSAVAQIHVKTEFDIEELTDVLISGTYNQGVFERCVSDRSLWFGAVFYSRTGAATTDRLQAIWKAAVKSARKKAVNMDHLPDCVIIVDGPAFLPTGNGAADRSHLLVRSYECGATAPAVFLSHLYDSLTTAGRNQSRRGEWFRMVSAVNTGEMRTMDI